MALLFNQIFALRSPYYATGKYKSSEVNAGKWKEVGTLDLVSSSEQCGLLCLNSNTATDELYSDDVCSGFEYNAENKNCVLGTIDESLEASETTKTVMLKYVEPWLIPVTKKSYSCNTDNTCCGEETSLTCCTSVAPCSVGEGGCTSDSYCSGDLVCGSGNCDISLGFTADHRCCMQKSHNCRGKFATETCCSSTSKCEEGEGHCSSDSVCGSGLKCGIQNCDYSLGFKFGYNCCYRE